MKKGLFLILSLLILLLASGRLVVYLKNTGEKTQNQDMAQNRAEHSPKAIRNETKEIPKSIDAQNLQKISTPPQEKTKMPISIENIVVSPYEGNFANFIPILSANSSLETSIQTAVRILTEKSGLSPTKEDVIKIYLTESKNLTTGYVYDINETSNGEFTIAVSLQKVLFNSLPVHELVASAIAEALLAKRNSNFHRFPRFFRFGIGAFLSGLSDYITKQEILQIEREGSKVEFSSLSGTSHPSLNGILLVKFLAEARGLSQPKDILPILSEEDELSKLIEKSTKFSSEEFEKNYIQYAKNNYSNYVKFGNQFYAIIATLRSLKEEEALPLLKEFLRTNPTDIHYGEGLYYLGYIYYRLGDYFEAEKVFNDFLINHSYSAISQGKAHYFLGRCYHLRGYPSLALKEYFFASLDENELLQKASHKKIEEISK